MRVEEREKERFVIGLSLAWLEAQRYSVCEESFISWVQVMFSKLAAASNPILLAFPMILWAALPFLVSLFSFFNS